MNVFLSVILCSLISVSVGFTISDISEKESSATTGLQRIQNGAQCGGSIINTKAILSAAHCFPPQENNSTWIMFGSTQISGSGADRVDKQADGVLVHPNFGQVGTNIYADIAIVYYSNVSYSIAIQPIALPADDTDLYENVDVSLIGWGVTTTSGGYASDQLQCVNTTSLANSNCVSSPITLNAQQICSKGTISSVNVGGCTGDSGGPLTARDVVDTLIGIISVRVGSCSNSNSRPTIHTRVSSYLTWIATYSS